MAFGQDAKIEGAVATLESPIFEKVPSQCWHFVFSLNVSIFFITLRLMNLGAYPSYYVQSKTYMYYLDTKSRKCFISPCHKIESPSILDVNLRFSGKQKLFAPMFTSALC